MHRIHGRRAGYGPGRYFPPPTISPAAGISRSEGEWKAIIDSLEDGYYECDLKGVFLVANSAMHRITECEPGEIIGKSYTSFYSPEEAKRIFEAYHEVFVTGKPARIVNFTGITKGGEKEKDRGLHIAHTERRGRHPGVPRNSPGPLSTRPGSRRSCSGRGRWKRSGILAGGIAHDYNNALTGGPGEHLPGQDGSGPGGRQHDGVPERC